MKLSIDDLPDDVASLKAMLMAAHAASEVAGAKVAQLAAEVDRLSARAERLDHIVSVLRRAQFGRRSERITDDQIELALEDVETGFGNVDAALEAGSGIARTEGTKARRANRGHLPRHLRPCEAWLCHDAKRSSSSPSTRTARAAAGLCT